MGSLAQQWRSSLQGVTPMGIGCGGTLLVLAAGQPWWAAPILLTGSLVAWNRLPARVVGVYPAGEDGDRELVEPRPLEAIGQLSAGIAHEINTPVQFIGDNLRFLQEAVRDLGPLTGEVHRLLDDDPAVREAAVAADLDFLGDEVPRALSESLAGVDRVANVVQAMKDFAQPDEGAALVPQDLNRMVRNVVAITGNLWAEEADLEMDLQEDLPPVTCRRAGIEQAVLELVVNAAEAIRVARRSENAPRGRIGVRTRAAEDGVELRVTDTGCGVPAEIQDRIFEPFFTTKPTGQGVGKGLHIAQAVVTRRHGGTLGYQPEPGPGAVFVMRLPFAGTTAARGEDRQP